MNNSEEIWLPLPSDDKYLISNYGKVLIKDYKCHKRQGPTVPGKVRLIPKGSEWSGYKSISIRCKQKLIHRLVAETFIPNPNNLPFINHKDSDKGNNFYKNLEWCTQSYNCKHSYQVGTNPIESKLGVNNGRAKLDELQIKTIRSIHPKLTQTQLGKYFGVSQTVISCVTLRKNWVHV